MPQETNFILKNSENREDYSLKQSKLPEIDFSTFIMSLHSSALVQLGEIPDPVTGIRTKDLSIAKQTIDLIAMLDKKTMGNLDLEEDRIIKSLLHELRMAYVKIKY